MLVNLFMFWFVPFIVCSPKTASFSSLYNSSVMEVVSREPQLIPFCELLENAEKYDEKLIATEAILIIYTQSQVDGAESFIYSLSCNRQDLAILVSDSGIVSPPIFDQQTINASKILDKIIEKAQKKKKVARARVKITGHFMVAKPPREGFGHLSWAKFKIARSKLYEVTEVPTSAPWPWSSSLK